MWEGKRITIGDSASGRRRETRKSSTSNEGSRCSNVADARHLIDDREGPIGRRLVPTGWIQVATANGRTAVRRVASKRGVPPVPALSQDPISQRRNLPRSTAQSN